MDEYNPDPVVERLVELEIIESAEKINLEDLTATPDYGPVVVIPSKPKKFSMCFIEQTQVIGGKLEAKSLSLVYHGIFMTGVNDDGLATRITCMLNNNEDVNEIIPENSILYKGAHGSKQKVEGYIMP